MIKLIKATQTHQNLIHVIFQLFSYDMSENKHRAMNWNGEYEPPSGEDEYIDGEGFETLIVSSDDEPAGLIVLSHEQGRTYLKHFFILRGYRAKGIAKKALLDLFERTRGIWYLSTFDHNENAQSFWERFLSQHTRNLKITRRADDKGPEYHFEV